MSRKPRSRTATVTASAAPPELYLELRFDDQPTPAPTMLERSEGKSASRAESIKDAIVRWLDQQL